MNILILALVGLVCGLAAHRFNVFGNKVRSIGAYLNRHEYPVILDLLLGVAGALIGSFIINGRMNPGLTLSTVELICAVVGGMAIIGIGRNINWFKTE